jgi:hypothetical protein
MTILPTRRPRSSRWLPVLVVLSLAGSIAPEARAQKGRLSRQVTLFGVIATPNDMSVDPKLASVAPKLRKLLPNHGFKLLDSQTKRVQSGGIITCDLGGGRTAAAKLLRPVDEDGKVRLRCELLLDDVKQFSTQVATPPNQLFFCDKGLDDGTRLLIGVGAR